MLEVVHRVVGLGSTLPYWAHLCIIWLLLGQLILDQLLLLSFLVVAGDQTVAKRRVYKFERVTLGDQQTMWNENLRRRPVIEQRGLLVD